MTKRLLDQEAIEAVFDEAESQEDYVLGLFKLAIPEWDDVLSLDGFVICNPATGNDLMHKAVAWDRDHKLSTVPGGAWMNYGFSTIGGDELENGEVLLPRMEMKA